MNSCLKGSLLRLLIVQIFVAGLLTACGGGGGGEGAATGPPPVFASRQLKWEPPTLYTDNTPLNPAADLDSYEIYVKTEDNFSPSDVPTASYAAVDPGTGQVIKSFDLALVGPFLPESNVYYVSMRYIAKNGMKSAFSSQHPSFSF